MSFNTLTGSGSLDKVFTAILNQIHVDGVNTKVMPAGTPPTVVYRIGDGTVHPEGWDNVLDNEYLDFYLSNAVIDNPEEVLLVAENITSVVTVANAIANVNTNATNITDINTVADNIADVNSYANTYVISATEPTSPTAGMWWYDSANNLLYNYNGTSFVLVPLDINALTGKTTPVDADELVIADSADSNLLKKLSWANVKATLKTYFDAIYIPLTAIGVTVQGYDANTAKYNDATANFTGTLQNGGSNVVVDTDIGSTVQAYDVDTAKLDVLQTFTISQRGTLTTDNDGSFDMNVTNNFKCTPTGNFTLTFTNISAQGGTVILDNSGGYTVSAAATTKVDSTLLATISVAGVYVIAYQSDGTNVYVTGSQGLA